MGQGGALAPGGGTPGPGTIPSAPAGAFGEEMVILEGFPYFGGRQGARERWYLDGCSRVSGREHLIASDVLRVPGHGDTSHPVPQPGDPPSAPHRRQTAQTKPRRGAPLAPAVARRGHCTPKGPLLPK